MGLSSRTVASAALLIVVLPLQTRAQARRSLDVNGPEAQLMGFYSAAMQFTPVGLPDRGGRLEIGGAGSVIPNLSLEDRQVGFGGTKPEDSNKCPVFPRLAASRGFAAFTVELGFTPPVTACGVRANILSAAIGRRFPLSQGWDGFVRLSGIAGSLRSAITCSVAFTRNPADQTCYNGTPSDDQVAPLSVALDFAAAYQGWRRARLEPYVAFGFRYERVDFDVNYTRTVAQGIADTLHQYPALDDHERMRAVLSRIQLAAGTTWAATERLRLGAEVYYAPRALFTLRGRASIVLGTAR